MPALLTLALLVVVLGLARMTTRGMAGATGRDGGHTNGVRRGCRECTGGQQRHCSDEGGRDREHAQHCFRNVRVRRILLEREGGGGGDSSRPAAAAARHFPDLVT